MILTNTSCFAAATIRTEVNRYRLLRDRIITEADLKKERHNRFFDLDLHVSSGVKSLIGDIKENTESSSDSEIAKQLAIAGVIAQNLNTERFVDIGIEAAAPLPLFQLYSYKFLPTLFFNINFGISLSFDSEDALNPEANLYIKKETQMGVFSKVNWGNKQKSLEVALYKMTRSDLQFSRTQTEIVEEESLFDFSDITKEESYLTVDMAYKRKLKDNLLTLEVRELQLLSMGSEKETIIGKAPLLHIRYDFQEKKTPLIFKPFVGFHYRQKYDAWDGLYTGLKLKVDQEIPFSFMFKFDSQFFMMAPKVSFKYFHFYYSLKSPYRNPQGDLWVSSIHNINIGFPFP
jgi:hypothetical protein